MHVERRTVVEAYARYDCLKKNRPMPDFQAWQWSQADAIDGEMERAGLKIGVPAGYLLWDKVEITMSDLRECAVEVGLFSGQPHRQLGLIERSGGLADWESKLLRHHGGGPAPPWYGAIKKGGVFGESAPFLLRPSVRGELPARWYVEDGSGRAATFVANESVFDPSKTLGIGYLGCEPDRCSSFMRHHFQELLWPRTRAKGYASSRCAAGDAPVTYSPLGCSNE
jgi:hypothetical protein